MSGLLKWGARSIGGSFVIPSYAPPKKRAKRVSANKDKVRFAEGVTRHRRAVTLPALAFLQHKEA